MSEDAWTENEVHILTHGLDKGLMRAIQRELELLGERVKGLEERGREIEGLKLEDGTLSWPTPYDSLGRRLDETSGSGECWERDGLASYDVEPLSVATYGGEKKAVQVRGEAFGALIERVEELGGSVCAILEFEKRLGRLEKMVWND